MKKDTSYRLGLYEIIENKKNGEVLYLGTVIQFNFSFAAVYNLRDAPKIISFLGFRVRTL